MPAALFTLTERDSQIPKMLNKQSSLSKHEFKVPLKDDLAFCVWQDTKAVMVLSNYHDPTERASVKRRKQARNPTKVVVPVCLSDYQKHMKGITLDQMGGYYQFLYRSKKWWRRLFLMVDGRYNAYIAARCAGGKTFTVKYKECSSTNSTRGNHMSITENSQKRRICRECALSRTGTDVMFCSCRQHNEAVHIECFGKHIHQYLHLQ